MAFSSSLFLFGFLPLVLLTLALPADWRKGARLALSFAFYFWGDPVWFAVLIVTTALDWRLSIRMESADAKKKRLLLAMSLAWNAGALLFTKYTNFFVETFHLATGTPFQPLAILLPLGISFITFQKLSYMIDVYKGKAPAAKAQDLFTYILFFPNIISGPIARWSEMAPAIAGPLHTTPADRLEGMFRFVLGLAKKVLIGNILGREADAIFALAPGDLSFFRAWYGALAYAFQLYFDFAGYSDMAIGLGMLLGLRLPENFRSPYAAESVTDFWRRWHITLGRWMREYIYIPLGGNRVSALRIYLNLWTVFFLSGLWHGANFTFVLWGAWHGLALVLERLAGQRYEALPRLLRTALTFLFVTVGWVFFRSADLSHGFHFLGRMFGAAGFAGPFPSVQAIPAFTFALAALLSFIPFSRRFLAFADELHRPQADPRTLALQFSGGLVVFIYAIGELAGGDAAPFIYFRF